RYHPIDKTECKRRFGFNPNEKHILVVASNLESKRMDLTQKVFDEVRKRRNDVKLIKAGYAETLVGDDIINTGWVPESEMPLLYNSADVFLHTSEYEGFCLPILEAMSCGVPVVVSNKASIPEVVGPCGNMVDLDAHDVIEQFANKIFSCIDKGIDEEAIEQSKNFSWQKTADRTIRVYEKVYDESRILKGASLMAKLFHHGIDRGVN
ncbi:MAG: glycosyltransferase, partial [Dehalococcoidia bacterium]|nr:glycosyltransferase [Dehalococcoidia bacterium]